MVKLVSDTIDKNDIKALIKWLSTDKVPKLTKGNLTVELEKKWAEKIGTKYSVFVNSGSSAILLMLAALKESDYLKNKKIIVPALSWVTDVSSPMLLGYETYLCDCNLEDLSCDLEHLEKLFIEHNPSVFISVCPLGLVPDMTSLINLCDKYDVLLLEDVCESMGSKYNNKYLGNFGFASVFSTYFGHHLSTIEGGFINTNNEEFYYALLMMRSHGWDRDLPKSKQEFLRKKYNVNEFEALYSFYMPGLNVRSTDLQAFIGIRAIDKLDNYSLLRNKNFYYYNSLIKDNEIKFRIRDTDFISNFAYPVVSYNKENIIKSLISFNIEVRPLIAGNIENKPFWYNVNKKTSDLKNANLIDRYGFYIPNHQDLTIDEIELISSVINNS
jgi:CDP-6-deoxy-D-xylo-4-hexulose-3-dehydrase